LEEENMDMKELMQRNEKFAKNADKKRLAELCKGQNPSTIVLTCSDSRVVPEFIFGCGLGELFVIRVAGNVACDCDVLASIEYAAEHLHCRNLLVLGHTNCGAVCAACSGKGEGNIEKLLCQVMPAVEKSGKKPEKAVPENVKLQMHNILEKSKLIAHLVEKKELLMFGAIYDIATGKVDMV
jgi:carbonic anhydrase